jgi:sigma-E factor negative regulatory protein RseA
VDQNQDKMPDTRLNEALSALMDGEVDDLELRRILRELPATPELAAVWKRYHAVRASLQQEMHVNPRADLLKGVQARLAAEAVSADMHEGRLSGMLRSRLARYVGQGAIAASVAVAALMGLSVLEVADGGEAGTGATAMVADAGLSPVLSGEFSASEQTRTVSLDSDAYNRLQQAVYREFSASPQIPYNPELPPELTPAE